MTKHDAVLFSKLESLFNRKKNSNKDSRTFAPFHWTIRKLLMGLVSKRFELPQFFSKFYTKHEKILDFFGTEKVSERSPFGI